MRSGTGDALWRQVQRLREEQQFRSASDEELATRFAESADGSAFDELFRRTAPLVWGVCARTLGATPEAEDAFQAVFVLLVQNVRKVRRRSSVAGWLYGTARKVTARAVRQRARRNAREKSNQEYREPEYRDAGPRDWGPLLENAIGQLPEKYRDVLLLCEIQQKSRAEAAQILRLSENTLSSRLARAKEMLRGRLEPTGIGLPAGAALALAAPEALRSATLKLCQHLASVAGEWSRIVPASVLPLLQGGSTTMFVSKVLPVFAIVLVAGFGLVNSQEPKPMKGEPPIGEAKKVDEKGEPKSSEKKRSRVHELRLAKVEAAKEWLDGLETRVQLGKDNMSKLRDAIVALTKAKLDVATSMAERETILAEQIKLLRELKELMDALLEAGSRARQEVAESKVYLLEAEIELELFKESLKDTAPLRR